MRIEEETHRELGPLGVYIELWRTLYADHIHVYIYA